MENYMKSLFAILVALMLVSGAHAASNTYYSQTTIYFNVPSDATFRVSMPADYASWTSITGTAEPGTATDWISFNFSNVPQSALQEPYQLGNSGNTQSGVGTPIIYLDPTSNVELAFDLKLASALPSGIQLMYNGTCSGTCAGSTSQTTLTNVTVGYTTIVDTMGNDEFFNLTLWANASSGASQGQTSRVLYIRSTGQ